MSLRSEYSVLQYWEMTLSSSGVKRMRREGGRESSSVGRESVGDGLVVGLIFDGLVVGLIFDGLVVGLILDGLVVGLIFDCLVDDGLVDDGLVDDGLIFDCFVV